MPLFVSWISKILGYGLRFGWGFCDSSVEVTFFSDSEQRFTVFSFIFWSLCKSVLQFFMLTAAALILGKISRSCGLEIIIWDCTLAVPKTELKFGEYARGYWVAIPGGRTWTIGEVGGAVEFITELVATTFEPKTEIKTPLWSITEGIIAAFPG